MSSFKWNEADGQPPSFDARGAYTEFSTTTRTCDTRTMSGFFIGRAPAGGEQVQDTECGEKVVSGFSLVETTVEKVVAELNGGEKMKQPQQQQEGGATIFDQKDDDDVESSAAKKKEGNNGEDKKDDDDSILPGHIISTPIKVRTLHINIPIWDEMWMELYQNDEVMDSIDSVVAGGNNNNNNNSTGGIGHHHHHQQQQQPLTRRCVIIRCTNRSREDDENDDGYSSPTSTKKRSLTSFKGDLSVQARSCGPVEWLRLTENRGEITVQFTTETAARIFHASCTTTTAGSDPSEVGGLVEMLQSQAGYGSVTAVLVPTQEKQAPRGGGRGGRGRGGGGMHDHQQQQQRPSLTLTSAAGKMEGEDKSSGLYYPDVGLILPPPYVKALLEPLCGSVDVDAVMLLPEEVLAKEKLSLSKCSGQEEEDLKAAVSKFTIHFNGNVDEQQGPAVSPSIARLKALHMLQFPLRQIFGLGLF